MASEQWKAEEIFSVINRYYLEVTNNHTSTFPEEFLNKLTFEILNRRDIDMSKRNLIIIGITYMPIDLILFYTHLRIIGINREFTDKSVPYDANNIATKRYLVVNIPK